MGKGISTDSAMLSQPFFSNCMPVALNYATIVKSCCGSVNTIQALFTFHYLFTQEMLKGMLISGGGEGRGIALGFTLVCFRNGQKWNYGIVQVLKTNRKPMLFALSVISWLSPAF